MSVPFEMYAGSVERWIYTAERVIKNAATGDWEKLLEDLGEALNSSDAVGEDLIPVFEKAMAAARLAKAEHAAAQVSDAEPS